MRRQSDNLPRRISQQTIFARRILALSCLKLLQINVAKLDIDS